MSIAAFAVKDEYDRRENDAAVARMEVVSDLSESRREEDMTSLLEAIVVDDDETTSTANFLVIKSGTTSLPTPAERPVGCATNATAESMNTSTRRRKDFIGDMTR